MASFGKRRGQGEDFHNSAANATALLGAVVRPAWAARLPLWFSVCGPCGQPLKVSVTLDR